MFYNQPLAHRFGKELASEIEGSKWSRIEIAVAWVRHSGMQHLNSSFRLFLERGGFVQVVVGIDIENTSVEGLRDLLMLQAYGTIDIFIHHNEASTTFHPKVYLLRNDKEARLIVGSNNLTQAGLFINTEAGLQIDASLSDPLIQEVCTAMANWRNPDTGFALKLDDTLLDDLVSMGYVLDENTLNKRRDSSNKTSIPRQSKKGQALFKTQRYTAPPIDSNFVSSAQLPGTVLLMRVRRASETERRTQIQIPIRVLESNFFFGISELTSDHDGRIHKFIEAWARGVLNTIKIEVPEIEPMGDPVLRLEKTDDAIRYRAYDANAILGAPIKHAILNGFKMNPPTSYKTISDEIRATMWRFI